ncbi:MAG: PH domain-containing protein, partial [Alphaproteobacteria bacterium]|nr:PH domain-containing protein [Alphaproteobacteria bacterium]
MGVYVNSVLLKDEHLVFATGIHWIVFVPGLAVLLAGLFLMMSWGGYGPSLFGNPDVDAVARMFSYVPLMIFGVGILLLGTAYISRISTELAVTNRRVIAKFGFISRTTYELFLNKVEGANVDQTIFGRIFNYGSVLVKGTGSGLSPIHKIAYPLKFQRHLLDQIERYQEGPSD